MGNGPDGFVVTEARNETTVDDLEDASFMLNCSIGSLIEKAAHVPVTLRRAWAVIHSRALFLSRACPHPRRREILGGSESRCLSTHLGNDLLRRIHPETGDFGQPLDCILMLPEQTCDLLVQLADLLLDPLQLLERHLYQVYSASKAVLQFGGLRQENQDMLSFDTTAISDNSGTEVSGFLGFTTLRFLDIKIDYRDGLVDFKYDRERFNHF